MPRQIISAADVFAIPGETVGIAVDYGTTDPPLSPAGRLNLQIYYDSSVLTFEEFTNVFETASQPIGLQGITPQEDTDDGDGDPQTDRFLTVLYADPNVIFGAPPTWPFGTVSGQPLTLFTANFTTVEELSTSNVNFVLGEVAAGFDNSEGERLASAAVRRGTPEQAISTRVFAVEDIVVTPGQVARVTIDYGTINPRFAPADGLAFRLHFDSQQLSFINLSEVFAFGSQPAGFAGLEPVPDTDDFDNDPSTDVFLPFVYEDPAVAGGEAGNWPFAQADEQPVPLFTANFQTEATFISSTLNLTLQDVEPGFDDEADEQLDRITIVADDPLVPRQALSVRADTASAGRVGVTVSYRTIPELASASGFNFNLFYNSEVLEFIDFSDIFTFGAQPAGLVGVSPVADTANADDDPSTDRLITFAYVDPDSIGGATGNWPFEEADGQPVDLFTANFATSAGFDEATINFAIRETQQGFEGVRDQTLGSAVARVNSAPRFAIDAFAFSVSEESPEGTSVGTVTAIDPNQQPVTFSITNGNPDDDGDGTRVFAIDRETGEISVADPDELNFETASSFELLVSASDPNRLANAAPVSVSVTNVNEPPRVLDATAEILDAVGAAAGDPVVEVAASDPDGDLLTFALSGGNAGGAFAIAPENGQITVADPSALDRNFTLSVTATDPGDLSATAAVNVPVNTPGNDDPLITNDGATFFALASDPPGTLVGTVEAIDPDGDSISFAIASGSDPDGDGVPAFEIGAQTGRIAIADPAEIGSTPFTLSVTADDSQGGLDTAEFTVVPANNPPIIENSGASFSIAANSSFGTLVGTVVASDADGDSLRFTLTGGNLTSDADGDLAPAFAIASSGRIFVDDSDELIPGRTFDLTVTVTDIGSDTPASSSAPFAVAVTEAIPAGFSLDADGDGQATPFNDGLIIFRFLAGLAPETFTGALSPDATRSPEQIEGFLEPARASNTLDADGDGQVTPFNDGLIIFRFLAGLAPETFTGALSPDATRSPEEIVPFLESLRLPPAASPAALNFPLSFGETQPAETLIFDDAS